MDLDDLRLFVRTAELASFTKAAVALGVAQPTVSRVIGQLETEWDGPLFYRTGRGVALSELGEEALARARVLLKDADQVGEDLRGFSRVPAGEVAIGMQQSIIPAVVPDLFNQLRRERPSIHLTIHEGFSDQIERWLAEGYIDIGLHSRYWEGELSAVPVSLASRLVLAGSAENPLPPEIEFAQLADYPLVLPPTTNGLRAIIDSVARRLKVQLRIAAVSDSIIGQKEAAIRCGCFMIKAPHAIADAQTSHLLSTSVICSPYVNRHIVMATGRQRPLSRAARDVAGRIAETLRRLSR